MLSASVKAGKGLFVQEAYKAVAARHFFHHFHRKLVLVCAEICRGKNRRHFVLGGSHFVVLGLGVDSVLPKSVVEFFHIFNDFWIERRVILVVHFLAFRRLGAKKRAACHAQILALVVKAFVYNKVFLFGAYGRVDMGRALVSKKSQDAQGLLVERFHGAQKRRLFVQGLAVVGAKGRRNAKRVFLYKWIGCGIPNSITARLVSVAAAAVGER